MSQKHPIADSDARVRINVEITQTLDAACFQDIPYGMKAQIVRNLLECFSEAKLRDGIIDAHVALLNGSMELVRRG